MKIRFNTLTIFLISMAFFSTTGQAMNKLKNFKRLGQAYSWKIIPKDIRQFHSSLPSKSYLEVMEKWANIKKQTEITPCNKFFQARLEETKTTFLEPNLFFGAENYLIKVSNEITELLNQEKDNYFAHLFIHERIKKIVPLLEMLAIECNMTVKEEVLPLIERLNEDPKSFKDLIHIMEAITYTIKYNKYHMNY